MMKHAILALTAAGILLAAVYAEEFASACDLAKVIPAFHCEDCDAVLEKKDLVSEKTVFHCEECDVYTEAGGQCGSCEGELAKKKTDKDACGDCFRKTAPVEACLKVVFECPDCANASAKAGSCKECEVKLVEVRSLALIEYQCSECGASQLKAGKCSDEECKNMGKPLERSCSRSGEAPHVAAPKGG